MDIVNPPPVADLPQKRPGGLGKECLADAQLLELVRHDAQQVEVRARAHHLASLAKQLDLSRGVRYAALLLVCGRGGKDDVSLQSRLGKKHLVDDEQLELAAAIAEGPKMRQRVRSEEHTSE